MAHAVETTRLIPQLSEKQLERFWSKIDKRGKNECWPWIAGRSGGYGSFSIGSAWYFAHRVAFALSKYDPVGALLRHSCHNPSCCNVMHLEIGDDRANRHDRCVLNGELAHSFEAAHFAAMAYAMGISLPYISATTGMSGGSVSGAVKRFSVPRRGHAGSFPQHDYFDVLARYMRGERECDIVRDTGFSRGAVNTIIRKYDLQNAQNYRTNAKPEKARNKVERKA